MQYPKGKLLSSKFCKLSAKGSSINSGPHLGDHDLYTSQIISQILEGYTNIKNYAQLSNFYNQTSKLLQSIKKGIEKAQLILKQSLNNQIMENIFKTKSKQELSKYKSICQGNSKYFDQMRCCDVYQVWQKISQIEAKLSNYQISQIVNKSAKQTNSIVQMEFENLSKYMIKYGEKEKQKKQTSQMKDFDKPITQNQQSQNQQRPTRMAVSRTIRNQQRAQRIQKNERLDPHSRKPRSQPVAYLTVSQLHKLEPKQLFNIKLKVIKIVKRFKIQSHDKIQFLGGDSTGVVTCVMNQRLMVRTNNTLEITNCKIYQFKGRLKQIQTSGQSKFAQVQDIGKINFNFNFTEGSALHEKQPKSERQRRERGGQTRGGQTREGQRREGQRRGGQRREGQRQRRKKSENDVEVVKAVTKIAKIEPGLQQLIIIAQVYKILNCQNDQIQCYIGDQTGIVKAILPQRLNFIYEGNSIKLIDVDSPVEKQHIVIKLNKSSKIQHLTLNFPIIKFTNNISDEAWQSEGEQNDQ